MTLVQVYEGESGIEVDPGIVALNPRSVDVLGRDNRSGSPAGPNEVTAI